MHDDREDRILEFQKAIGELGLPPDERPGQLLKFCPDDPELRAEVLRRLGEDGPRNAKSAFEVDRSESADPLLGSIVDRRFRIDALLPSQGGMGTVYRAARVGQDVEQLVALKVLTRGLNTEALILRFKRERKIQAQLQHPAIVTVLEMGALEDGRPYYVMEWIADGVPLDVFCAERHLGLRQRVQLIQQVCDAVQYAHQHSVVHRDLKPGNVLVTPDGRVKLLDFGLAYILGEEGAPAVTRARERIGTPAYMSPEQAAGERPTQQTDQYSIGMILFELITGIRPYNLERLSGEAMLQTIRQSTVPLPSEATAGLRRATPVPARQLRGDLDQIVLYALRKEPERRYQSVAHLRDDLERFLEGLPVRAQPPSTVYRVGKFVARYRAALATAAALVVAVIVIAVVQTGANIRFRQLVQERESALERSQMVLASMVEQDALTALASGKFEEAARLVGLAPSPRPTVVGQIIRSEVSRLNLGFVVTSDSDHTALYDRHTARTFLQNDESVARNPGDDAPASTGALRGYLLTATEDAPYIVGFDRDTAFGVKRADREGGQDTFCSVTLATMECRPLFPVKGIARGGSIDPTGTFLSFVDADGWHLVSKTGTEVDSIEGVREARWIGPDRLLLVAFNLVSAYHVSTKTRQNVPELEDTWRFAIGSGGVLAAERDDDVLLFDYRAMKRVGAIKARPHGLAFSRSGRKLALLMVEGEVQVWGLDSETLPGSALTLKAELLRSSDAGKYPGIPQNPAPRVSFSTDDSLILVSGLDSRVLGAESLRTLVRFDGFGMKETDAIFYSPHDRIGLSAPLHNRLAQSTSGLASRLVFRAPARGAALSGDGAFVLAINPTGVSVFDRDGRKVQTIAESGGGPRQPVVVSHPKTSDVITLYDRARLARWSLTNSAPVWSVDVPEPVPGGAEETWTRNTGDVPAVGTPVWSDDGAWVVVQTSDYLTLFDARTGREAARKRHTSRTDVLRFVNSALRVGQIRSAGEGEELVETVHSLPTLAEVAITREIITDTTRSSLGSSGNAGGAGRCLRADLRDQPGAVVIQDADAGTQLLTLDEFRFAPTYAQIHPAGTVALVVAGQDLSVWSLGVQAGTTVCRGDR